jgi:hypothetical protein
MTILLLASGVAIDLYTQRGLSTNCLTLLLGIGVSFQLFRVTKDGIIAYRQKSAVQLEEVQLLLQKVDSALQQADVKQNHLIQNVALTNQALAQALEEKQSGNQIKRVSGS